MRRRRLIEALFSVLDSVSTALVLFLSFHLVSAAGDSSALGAWTVIQGLMVVSRIADSGAGANLTRFVRVNQPGRSSVVKMAFAGLAVSAAPVSILAVVSAIPILWYVLSSFSAEVSVNTLTDFVLASTLFAVLNSFANALLSISEGRGHLAQRNVVVFLTNALSLAAAPLLIDSFGILGIAAIYLTIAGLQVVGAVFLQFLSPSVEGAWSSDLSIRLAVRDLRASSLALSGIALVRLSFEPLTRLLLSMILPLSGIPAFEIALRTSTQVRLLLQAAAQPLLGVGARARNQAMTASGQRQFVAATSLFRGLSSWLFASLLFASLALGVFSLGRATAAYMMFVLILVAGNWMNAMGGVGYVFQVSGGKFRGLMGIHLMMAGFCLYFGVAGVVFRNPVIVVVGYAAAFAYGGLASYRAHNGSVNGLFSRGGAYQVFGDLVLAVGIVGVVWFLASRSTAVSIWSTEVVGSLAIALLLGSVGLVWCLRGALSERRTA